MNLVLLGVLGYVVVQLGVGALVSRRIQTEDDYLVAGRSLGYGLSIFTIFATWFGAETCIGAAGNIYESGISGGSSDPFGYGVCLILMGLLFAVPLWNKKLTTLADLFKIRFSGNVERIAVLLMVPTSILWGAAQIRAFGQVLSASSDLSVTITITIAALVVIVYTISGGLLADAWTDVVQGVALIIGLAVVAGIILAQEGFEPIRQIHPDRFQLFGGGETPFLAVLEEWAIPICGSGLAAELVARIVATRTPTIARRSSFIAAGIYLAIGMIPVLLGLIGFVLIPNLSEPEQVLPLLAQQYLPGALYIIFAGALVSAILSTVDSALLVAASLVSHNVIVPLIPGITEKRKVGIARICVALFGVLAYLLALSAEGVYALVEEASAFGSAGVFIVIVFGLFSRFGGEYSAIGSLVAGAGVWILGAYLMPLPYPYLNSLAAALIAYVSIAYLEKRYAVNTREDWAVEGIT